MILDLSESFVVEFGANLPITLNNIKYERNILENQAKLGYS